MGTRMQKTNKDKSFTFSLNIECEEHPSLSSSEDICQPPSEELYNYFNPPQADLPKFLNPLTSNAGLKMTNP